MADADGPIPPEELLRRIESMERRLAELEARSARDGAAQEPAASKAAPSPRRYAPSDFLASTPAKPRPQPPHSRPADGGSMDRGPLLPASLAAAKADAPPVVAAVRAASPAERPGSMGGAERFVGTRLIGWIGALFALGATAMFLKLSFDRGWISPSVRIVIGAFGGLALFAGAEILHRRALRPIAAATAGAGLAILTLTNWAAFHLYGFTEFSLAFGLGCAITLLGFGWSVARSLLPTMLLALLGGFLTPMLIRAPTSGPWGITIYLAVLTSIAAALAALRAWRSPSVVALVGTVVVFVAWGVSVPPDRIEGLQPDIATCAALLATVFVADVGLRAVLGGAAGRVEAALLAAAVLGALPLVVGLQVDDRLERLGIHLLTLAGPLAVIAARGRPEALAVRGAALVLAIGLFTGAVPCFFSRAALGIVWALEAAALAMLEKRTQAFVPLMGAFVVHALVAGRIAAFGEGAENQAFLWSERATVCAVEVGSLLLLGRAMGDATGARAVAGRIAMAAAQVFVAVLLHATVPADRVTAAWTAQALGAAWLALRTRQTDFAAHAAALVAAAAFRFLSRLEWVLDFESFPVANARALSLALAGAAGIVMGRALEGDAPASRIGALAARAVAASLLALALAGEVSFLVRRSYGVELPILELDPRLESVPWAFLANPRFAFLAVAALALGLSTRVRDLGGGAKSVWSAAATIAAHLLFLGATCLEVMGLADPAVGADPFGDSAAFRASNVQVALSITLAVVPALALAIGFRRSRVHRYFGLAGLLAAAAKVALVDLADVALEWRMLSTLGIGALLMLGGLLYSRAARTEASREARSEATPGS